MTSRSRDVATAAPAARLAERANAEAIERMFAADPVLVDVRPAREIVPDMTGRTILTSGSPLEWDEYTGGQRRGILGGDDLHTRTPAATLLFARELYPALLDVAERRRDDVRRPLAYLSSSDYFFLRLSMGSSKATADAAHGLPGSSVVSSMTFNCRD